MGEHDPNEVPESWMNHEGFTQLLEQAVCGKDAENWYTHMHLGVVQLVNGQLEASEKTLRKSITLRQSAWAHYALACLYWKCGKQNEAVEEAIASLRIKNDDLSLARAVIVILDAAKKHQEIIRTIEALPVALQEDGSLVLSLACAYLAAGEIERAEEIGGYDPEKYAYYVREGSIGPTSYWLQLQKAKLERQGINADVLINQIPIEWDFRMG